MKFTWIYILCCAVVVTTCVPTSERPQSTLEIDEEKVEEGPQRQETLEDLVDLGNQDTDLPILPPIILIDFTNGTNLTSEEKSKRTINGNLGYGFQSNNLFSGKYNYYFPAGKTGTTVSIEESISPFLPKTIIEKVNSHQETLYSNPNANLYSNPVRSNLFGSNLNGHVQSQIGSNGAALVFGQRTKLQKSTGENFQSFSRFTPTQNPNYAVYTTPKTNYQSNEYSSGLGLGSYTNPTSTYEGYSTPRTPIYEGYSTPRTPIYNSPNQGRYNSVPASTFQTYNAPIQNYGGVSTTGSPPIYNSPSAGSNLGNYGQQGVGLQSYTTPRSQNYNPSQSQTTVLSPLKNSPHYSYEDGVKYEHKIVWKYPNGMVSDVGPDSYDGTYPEYSSNPTKISLTSNYQNPGPSNNFPKTLSSGYSVNAGSIYSQKPATFPDNGASGNDDSKPNQFVSSASISNGQEYFTGSSPRPTPPSQKYSFQNTYSQSVNNNGQLTKTQSSTLSPVSSYNPNYNKPNVEEPKVISNYPVDSPQAEYTTFDNYPPGESYEGADAPQASPYTYSQISSSYEQSPSSSSGAINDKVQPTVLSKYTPQAQQYLKKALGIGGSGQRQNYNEPPRTAESYSNIQYSNLLDYNPSLSQYVRDPSSILNAQPTFVQAGNSLIPVIILRVDGVAPIQPKVTPNINLKALLQKYLTQYAQTVNDLSQEKNYDQGYESSRTQGSSSSKLFDLGQLTETLGQLGSRGNFKQHFAENFAQSIAQDYQPSSFPSTDSNDGKYSRSGTREGTKKPKVKNVQIIDDPRFTTYKVKN